MAKEPREPRLAKPPKAKEPSASAALVPPRPTIPKLQEGATAAQALLGKQSRVTQQRGEFVGSPLAPYVMATVHPSSILRAPDEETRRRETELFIRDLEKIAPLVKG